MALTPRFCSICICGGTGKLKEHGGLLLHHLVDRGSTATLKGEVHLADGVGIQGVTRAVDIANSPSSPPGSMPCRMPSSAWESCLLRLRLRLRVDQLWPIQ
jgi:hypothetical protein